jgi:hypothetical protein
VPHTAMINRRIAVDENIAESDDLAKIRHTSCEIRRNLRKLT